MEKFYEGSGLHDACKHTITQQLIRKQDMSNLEPNSDKRINFIMPMSVIAGAYLCKEVRVARALVAADKRLLVTIMCLLHSMGEEGWSVTYNSSLQQVCSMLYEEAKKGRLDEDQLMRNTMFREFCLGEDAPEGGSFPAKNPTLTCVAIFGNKYS